MAPIRRLPRPASVADADDSSDEFGDVYATATGAAARQPPVHERAPIKNTAAAATTAVTTSSDAEQHPRPRNSGGAAIAGPPPPPPRRRRQRDRARLPAMLQFPLLIILSMSISSLGFSLMTEWSQGDLAAVSRYLDTWTDVAVLAAWRITELGLGWFGNCDWLDLAALNVLSHGPVLYLLAVFYRVSPSTAVAALSIDVIATLVPFLLLRPLSRAHAGDGAVPNREIISDLPLGAYTVGLAAAIYSVVLVSAFHLYLPRILVLHFEGIPSLTPAYTASYWTIVPVMLLFGLAARTFIFTPFAATGRSRADAELEAFDPVRASLRETVRYNAWGYTTKTKVVAARTLIAAVVTAVNVYLQCSITIAGIEPRGGLGYAAVWTVAATLAGMGLALID